LARGRGAPLYDRDVGVWVRKVALALFAALALTAAPAQAQTAADETCGSLSPSAAPCTGLDKLAERAAAECRRIGVPAKRCALPLGHRVSRKIVARYRKTWLHAATAFQYGLGDGLPFLRAQWLGTHNSFNSTADDPTLSHTDSNQQLSLTDQLDIDMRSLELDLHYIPSAAAGGASTVVVCHGRGPDEAHFGCTNEPTFAQVLPRIAGWLDGHPHQVILLYLEDELGADAGYTETLATLDKVLGTKLYRPSASEMTAKGCANLPLGISRDDVRARGAQVVLVGNCRSGWARDVYGWDDVHVESGSTPDYKPFPACDASYGRDVYDSKLVRYYEDSTFVATAIDPTQTPAEHEAGALTPDKVGSMVRCGVGLFGFDQILPHDGRISASIWSWAKNEPNPNDGRCGLQRAQDGRWITAPCKERHRAVCRNTDGSLSLTRQAVPYTAADSACGKAAFDLPRTGYENSLLRAQAGSDAVWLRHRLN
jgi:hypothetical protein